MKTAMEFRAGNVIMLGKDPMVVQRAEFSKSGRNASVVKMKLKNLLSGTATETVYRADEKFELVMLDRGKDLDWFGSPTIVALTIAAFVGLAFFVANEDDLKKFAKAPGASGIENMDEPGGGKRLVQALLRIVGIHLAQRPNRCALHHAQPCRFGQFLAVKPLWQGQRALQRQRTAAVGHDAHGAQGGSVKF